jgi:hypothetical protein
MPRLLQLLQHLPSCTQTMQKQQQQKQHQFGEDAGQAVVGVEHVARLQRLPSHSGGPNSLEDSSATTATPVGLPAMLLLPCLSCCFLGLPEVLLVTRV